MNKMKSILISALLLASAAFSGDFVVIVNPANSASSVSNAELKRLFTGKMGNFGGQKAVPINLADSDPIFGKFAEAVVKMTASEYKRFWVEAQIKGEGTAPMVQRNSSAAKMIVATIPGAIAYVDESVVDGTVKVLPLK